MGILAFAKEIVPGGGSFSSSCAETYSPLWLISRCPQAESAGARSANGGWPAVAAIPSATYVPLPCRDTT
ncbi:Uncharacterised protein [Actinobacillus pleuropneumoniae]|nr:Uncharacterised protein [Actinobacillus pleuropneumoniae]